MEFTRKTLHGRLMKGIDMKKISSVISLSVLVLFLLVSCENSSTDNTINSSSDWVQYRHDVNGNVRSYKKANIEKDAGNNMVRVWEKNFFSDKGREEFIQYMIKRGHSTEEYDNLAYMVYLYEIDCEKQRLHILSVSQYDKGNKNYLSGDKESEWINIPPDSLGDSLQKNVCK